MKTRYIMLTLVLISYKVTLQGAADVTPEKTKDGRTIELIHHESEKCLAENIKDLKPIKECRKGRRRTRFPGLLAGFGTFYLYVDGQPAGVFAGELKKKDPKAPDKYLRATKIFVEEKEDDTFELWSNLEGDTEKTKFYRAIIKFYKWVLE